MQGEHLFNKKLIPHIYMSKDQIPPSLNCDGVLSTIYTYIQDWKRKLYELMSHNTKIPQVTLSVRLVHTGCPPKNEEMFSGLILRG